MNKNNISEALFGLRFGVFICALMCVFFPAISESHVKCPDSFRNPGILSYSLFDGRFKITVYSEKFEQGGMCYAEIEGGDDGIKNIRASFGDIPVALSRRKWGWRAFFPISPEHKTGTAFFDLSYREGKKEVISHTEMAVLETKFKVSKHAMNLGRFSRVRRKPAAPNPNFVKRLEYCRAKKDAAFALVSDDFTTADVSHPRDMHYVTSGFYETRFYKRYYIKKRRRVFLEPQKRTHMGVDLRGCKGSSVFAVLRGRVVLAEKMHYEGNMVILDHGNGFFTYYMHMEKIDVNEGDIVDAGFQIGTVGSTGMSTGPHLHVSAVINGIQVNPLSLVYLPLRD